jgi:hypothetical protein
MLAKYQTAVLVNSKRSSKSATEARKEYRGKSTLVHLGDVLPEVVSSAGWTGISVVVLLFVGLLVYYVRVSTFQESLREVWGIVYCVMLKLKKLYGFVFDRWNSCCTCFEVGVGTVRLGRGQHVYIASIRGA